MPSCKGLSAASAARPRNKNQIERASVCRPRVAPWPRRPAARRRCAGAIESTPTFATGLFGWLIGYRLLVWWRKTGNELPTWMLLALSVTVAALTFIAEAIALGIQANVSPLRVLQSAFDFDLIRPGWLVLGAGLIVVALDFACARFAKQRRAARQVERVLAARV
jgi:hypothetical protein